jgi:DNA polymerase-3 subunit alpha
MDVAAQSCTPAVIAKLKELLGAHRGTAPVQVRFASSQGVRPLDVGTFRVEPGEGLLSELRVLLGSDAVRVVPFERARVVDLPEPTPAPT